jgi:hypothetical protein
MRASFVVGLLVGILTPIGLTSLSRHAFASLPFETESARLLPPGRVKLEAAFEYQSSPEGREAALPLVVEYGLTRRVEFTVEPIPYSLIAPGSGRHATGLGDLEMTVTALLHDESKRWPGVAAALEIKSPTARDTLIGTGKTDYTLTLVASRRVGRADVHANLGYTVLGAPAGVSLHNIYDYALACEYAVSDRLHLVGEVIGNTPSTSESGGLGEKGNAAPELAGGELVGMLGARWRVVSRTWFSLGVNYDNNGAVLFRPGLTAFFGR